MANDDDSISTNPAILASLVFAILFVANPEALGLPRSGHDSPVIPRTSKMVSDIFRELGPYYRKRAYRMDTNSFWMLHSMLHKYINPNKKKRNRKHKYGVVNGTISSQLRLSMAIRFFAGGSVYDISVNHGVGVTEVYKSVSKVIKAINSCPELEIEFLQSHEKQLRIADGFKKKSKVDQIKSPVIWVSCDCTSKWIHCPVKGSF